ncbi:MAG: hypothetical protein HQK86_09855 [Nitrospinae bacterium]|nr:hypothetical protein [Nitrospinota bacterium]
MLKKLEQMTRGRNFSYYWILTIFVANVFFILSIQGWLIYIHPEDRTWGDIFRFATWHLVFFFVCYFPTITAFSLSWMKSDPIPQIFSTTAVTAFYLWVIWVVSTDESSTAVLGLIYIPTFGILVAGIGYYIGVRFENYCAKLKHAK